MGPELRGGTSPVGNSGYRQVGNGARVHLEHEPCCRSPLGMVLSISGSLVRPGCSFILCHRIAVSSVPPLPASSLNISPPSFPLFFPAPASERPPCFPPLPQTVSGSHSSRTRAVARALAPGSCRWATRTCCPTGPSTRWPSARQARGSRCCWRPTGPWGRSSGRRSCSRCDNLASRVE